MRQDSKLKQTFRAAGWKPGKLAVALDIKPQAISQWKQVPLARVFEVERITGIPARELRPDFFPEKESAV